MSLFETRVEIAIEENIGGRLDFEQKSTVKYEDKWISNLSFWKDVRIEDKRTDGQQLGKNTKKAIPKDQQNLRRVNQIILRSLPTLLHHMELRFMP